jgi:hypothetical protein
MRETQSTSRNVTVMQRCNLKGSLYTINRNELGTYSREVGIATSLYVYISVLQATKWRPCISVVTVAEPGPIDSPAFILNVIFCESD